MSEEQPNNKQRQNACIGIFDSGFGGLTVLRAIAERFPNEDLLYLGDTARVPYGTRTPRTVLRYAERCAAHLAREQIKLLVVACNTVSAVALDDLSLSLDMPVLGVIHPGAQQAVRQSKQGRIGILATAGTVASGAYVRAVAACSSRAEVFAEKAPLLVPLVEEGWLEGELPELAIRRYLEPLVKQDIDTLLLGCTHYPVLHQSIETQLTKMAGRHLNVIDSGAAAAEALFEIMSQRGLQNTKTDKGALRIHLSDLPGDFEERLNRFFGKALQPSSVTQIDL
ncbi:MAG: glutamate racemase [Myxococcales bacterium]|nr:MAG: glutamate racemase [Myxococcales bacterium]